MCKSPTFAVSPVFNGNVAQQAASQRSRRFPYSLLDVASLDALNHSSLAALA